MKRKIAVGTILILALAFGAVAFADGLTPTRATVLAGALSVVGADSVYCDSVPAGFVSVTMPCPAVGDFRITDSTAANLGSHLNIIASDLLNGGGTIPAANLDVGLWGGGVITAVAGDAALKPIVRPGFFDAWTSIGLVGVSPVLCSAGSCNGVYDLTLSFQITYDLPMLGGQYDGTLVSQLLSGP